MTEDFRETRAVLLDLRARWGAETPVGHACSNLLEMTENYAKTADKDQRRHLIASIEQQKTALDRLLSQSR